ncbi:MAG TPA: 50S ribosomal protein L13 [Candidatus Thermoplasmatota archaeon]|nr:50S ribosomal protein L13 [Candidatus Thermoplasmatota archaeon]
MATVINGENLVLGRMASQVAKRLLNGEEIHIVNAEKVIITGTRDSVLENFDFKRDVGTNRKGPFYPRTPHMIVKRTVRGMVGHRFPRGRAAYKNLKVWIGVPEELANEPLTTLEKASTRTVRYVTVGEISKYLGAKF